LRQFLAEHGHLGGLGWFLDALGFTTLSRTALNNNVGGPSMSSERPRGLVRSSLGLPPELIGPAR
jgi:hypothetical protein